MTNYKLTNHFNHFFNRLNPSPTFVQQAAREHTNITGLLEDRNGSAAPISPICFLQGSYRQQTAIYTINDIDIVALCSRLSYPGSGSGESWSRDEIFRTLAAPLRENYRYKDKVRYNSNSMCIKVDLGIKVEILPVVHKAGNDDSTVEPFVLFRPKTQQWEDGYARYHQSKLSSKNGQADKNFIPVIKVFKHLRSQFELDAVSFHIECLLYHLPNQLFFGSPADYIFKALNHLGLYSAEHWYQLTIRTPCGERALFSKDEWNLSSWQMFHKSAAAWLNAARLANEARDQETAIEVWQLLLGKEFFPRSVSV